jgi:hypothetical protein
MTWIVACVFSFPRTWRTCSGQAAVETVFAMVVLVLLILVTAQLFYLSDKTIFLMAAVHKTARESVHGQDRTFTRIEEVEEGRVQTLPGMQWALEYLGASRIQDEFEMRRTLFVYGGAYQGLGESAFVRDWRGRHPCPRGMSGRREDTILEVLGQ